MDGKRHQLLFISSNLEGILEFEDGEVRIVAKLSDPTDEKLPYIQGLFQMVVSGLEKGELYEDIELQRYKSLTSDIYSQLQGKSGFVKRPNDGSHIYLKFALNQDKLEINIFPDKSGIRVEFYVQIPGPITEREVGNFHHVKTGKDHYYTSTLYLKDYALEPILDSIRERVEESKQLDQ